jgi:hypothetical protein
MTAETAPTSNGLTLDMVGSSLGCDVAAKLCVRKTTCGQFAVIVTIPDKKGTYRCLKALPTLDRAKAYMRACSR